MYLFLIILSAFCISVCDILKLRFYDSSFSGLKPPAFWNPNFEKTDEQTLRWLTASNIFRFLSLVLVLIAPVLAQFTIFQIRGVAVVYQVIACVLLYIAVYNIVFHHFFQAKKPAA